MQRSHPALRLSIAAVCCAQIAVIPERGERVKLILRLRDPVVKTISASLLKQGASRVGKPPERLLAWDFRHDAIVVPSVFGLCGFLDLHDVHVMLHQSVGADDAIAG